MSAEPTPDVCRAAALGCFVAAFMASQLGYSTLAEGLLSIAGALVTYAEMLDKRNATARKVPATNPARVASATVPLTANVGASGGVLALPALRVDNSALIAAIGGFRMDAALMASLSASLEAIGKTFADAIARSLQPTIDAMVAAHAESARKMVDQIARSWAFKFPATATVLPA